MIKRHRKTSVHILGVLVVMAFTLVLSLTDAWAPPAPKDQDNDGFYSDVDCNDKNAAINPEALEAEACNDGDDNDCDGLIDQDDSDCGLVCTDSDGDTFFVEVGCPEATDCNDANPAIYPGASEACDGLDNQCPGDSGYEMTDEGCNDQSSCTDEDEDGYYVEVGCEEPLDCDDSDESIYPGASEACDGVDNQCPGYPGFDTIDEDCAVGDLDTDGDGFPDSLEQQTSPPFELPAGMSLALNGATTISPCPPSPTPDQRALCWDYQTPDAFWIVDRATGCPPLPTPCGEGCAPYFGSSNIPSPPYDNPPYDPGDHYDVTRLIPRSLGAGGLEVAVHEIIQDSTVSTSQAIGPHFATRLVEDLDPCQPFMGLATFGTPGPGSTFTVWTEKVKNWTEDACFEACFTDKNGNETCYTPNSTNINSFTCKNANSSTVIDMRAGQSVAPLVYEFIVNLGAHEDGHAIALASGPDTSGHHYAIAEGVIMEQFIDFKATKSGSKQNPNIAVTLYISESYSSTSQAGYQLTVP